MKRRYTYLRFVCIGSSRYFSMRDTRNPACSANLGGLLHGIANDGKVVLRVGWISDKEMYEYLGWMVTYSNGKGYHPQVVEEEKARR